MPEFDHLKHQLADICDAAIDLLDSAEAITTPNVEGLSQWRATCETISGQILEDIMRVAVVGAIKSGKSTLVNTLFGGDYLKRGAGVVTSIVTRVRSGHRLRAILSLKNWEEINRDIDQAAVLLPAHRRPQEKQPFDIRDEVDRHALTQALDELAADQLISNDTRSAGSVLLSSYLGGFDRVRQQVGDDHNTVAYDNEAFARHRAFVGDDALAVYLKDVELEIHTPGLGPGVEVADCQGSDSPNPLHMAMIQDYLMLAHLTIYAISSRTGLRQADIRFLSMIRKMGIMDTVAFVVNCDFSEHDTLEDLKRGIAKIESDLKLLCPQASLFTFSALFLLMEQMDPDLSRRDIDRLAHWHQESSMVDFARDEHARFHDFLKQKINQERSRLLLKNHLERLEIVAGGIDNWIGFNRDLLARDASGAQALARRAQQQRAKLDRLKRTVKNTLDGAAGQVKKELQSAINGFFDPRAGGVVDGVVRFVRGYRVDLTRYDESLQSAGFAKTLYLVFQEFKQALDAYMAESMNPAVIHFVKSQEVMLSGHLDEIAEPYGAMIDEAIKQVAGEDQNGPAVPSGSPVAIRIGQDLEAIRKTAGLRLPPATATMHYSAQIKTEAVMRFGLYRIVNLVKKSLKRSADRERDEQFLALASGIKRMKRETERSILFHMKDYKENIKFQYMLKLVDAASALLFSQVQERFSHHGADLSRLVELMREKGLDKENVADSLASMQAASQALQEKISRFRDDLGQLEN